MKNIRLWGQEADYRTAQSKPAVSLCLLVCLLAAQVAVKAQTKGAAESSAVAPAKSMAQKKPIKAGDIQKILESAHIVQEHFTGFCLYDEAQKKMIYDLNGDKYFVPASNTKLFTFYTALNMLGDSLPGLRYIVRGDSLIFWGTGDPSFLHPDLDSHRVFEFLKSSGKRLFYSASNYKPTFGNHTPVAVSPMPVYSNTVEIYATKEGLLKTKPAFFEAWLTPDGSPASRGFRVRKEEGKNSYSYPYGVVVPAAFKQEIDLKPDPTLVVRLLQDALQLPVVLVNEAMPGGAGTVYSIPSDSLYRRMLLPSDNYLAEQTVILCASTFAGPLDVDSVHAYSKAHFLNGLPAEPHWVSGAGFPPNLFTPETIVALLIRIKDKIGNEQRLHQLLPNGGVSGTLKDAYKTDNGEVFVFAKTGTLQYVHNQSGYLVTRSGRRLIFSFMNNNFVRTTTEIRDEMVRVMTEIHNRY
jgi:D-alanyl-D-alanine carboxypeptidase/D-alanyl-D-alanine-endopeptidase (penicillin-binding protein 4)